MQLVNYGWRVFPATGRSVWWLGLVVVILSQITGQVHCRDTDHLLFSRSSVGTYDPCKYGSNSEQCAKARSRTRDNHKEVFSGEGHRGKVESFQDSVDAFVKNSNSGSFIDTFQENNENLDRVSDPIRRTWLTRGKGKRRKSPLYTKWRRICCRVLPMFTKYAWKFPRAQRVCKQFKCTPEEERLMTTTSRPKPTTPPPRDGRTQWGWEWDEPTYTETFNEVNNPGKVEDHTSEGGSITKVNTQQDKAIGAAIIIFLSVFYLITTVAFFVSLPKKLHERPLPHNLHDKHDHHVIKEEESHPGLHASTIPEFIQHIHIHLKEKKGKHKKKEEESHENHDNQENHDETESSTKVSEPVANESEPRNCKNAKKNVETGRKTNRKGSSENNGKTEISTGCKSDSRTFSPKIQEKGKTDLEAKELAKEILGLTAEGMHTAAYSLLLVNVLSEVLLDVLEHGETDPEVPGGKHVNATTTTVKPIKLVNDTYIAKLIKKAENKTIEMVMSGVGNGSLPFEESIVRIAPMMNSTAAVNGTSVPAKDAIKTFLKGMSEKFKQGVKNKTWLPIQEPIVVSKVELVPIKNEFKLKQKEASSGKIKVANKTWPKPVVVNSPSNLTKIVTEVGFL